MLTRLLLRSLLLVGLVMPLSAFGLGVGALQVRSALYQNLEAEIPLVVSNPAELIGLKVQIPRQQVFDQMGVERQAFFANLRFAVQSHPSGSSFIKITSTQPIRDPNFDLLIEAVWPRGRLLRTFPVQVDPEMYAQRQQPPPPILEEAQTPAPNAATPATTPAAPTSDVSFEGATTYGPVRRGENLSQIARQVRPSTAISIPRMKEILVAGNPEAFSRGNPNTLRVGATLRIPTPQALGVEAAPPPDTAALTPAAPAALSPEPFSDATPAPGQLAPPPPPEPVAEVPTAPPAEVAPPPAPVELPTPQAPATAEAPAAETTPVATTSEPLDSAPKPSTEPPPALPEPQEIVPQATLPQPTAQPTTAPPPAETPAETAPQEPAPAPVVAPPEQTPPPLTETAPAPEVEAETSWFFSPVVWIAILLIALAVGAIVLLPTLRRSRQAAAATPQVEEPAEDEPPTAAAEEATDSVVRTRMEILRNRRSRRVAADEPEEADAHPPTVAVPAKPAPKAATAAPPKPIDELLKNIDFNLGGSATPEPAGLRMPDAEPPTASVTKTRAQVATPPSVAAAPPSPTAAPAMQPPLELPSGLQFDKMEFDLSEIGLDTPKQSQTLPPLELTPPPPTLAKQPAAKPADDDWGALDFEIPALEPTIQGTAPSRLAAAPKAADKDRDQPTAPSAADLKFEFTDVSQEHREAIALIDADLQGFDGGLGVDEATLDMEANPGTTTTGSGAAYLETKLDLASAYLDMGDPVMARNSLEDVLKNGDAGQKKRAEELLKKLG